VVNVLAIDGREYLVSPRGNTQWARNARAAGQIEMGPRWGRTVTGLRELADDAKADVLKRYLDRWYWEVKGHVGGLTPASTEIELAAAAPGIPVFELTRQPAGSSPGLPNSAAVTCITSSRACRLAASQDTAAGN
jgi:hypothetical protein